MKVFESVCLLVIVGVCNAFPKSGYYPRRSYMVGGSYYSNPRYIREGPGYEYFPPGQMTAMVVGDTVATNSFAGPAYGPPVAPPPQPAVLSIPESDIEKEQIFPDQTNEKQQPSFVSVPEPDSVNETEPEEVSEQPEHNVQNGHGQEQETLFSIENESTTEAVVVSTTQVVPTRAPVAKKPKSKVSKAKRPVPVAPPKPAEEQEDDDEDAGLPASWPFGAGRAGVPAYNAFFPIFIGGASPSGRSRTRSTGAQQDEAFPGSATAIANSFSTGKGGVATSHATSFGDPYAAAMLRNYGLYNFKNSHNRKQPVHITEDDE